MYLLRDISAYFLDTFTSLVLYNYSNNIQNHMVSTVKRNCNLSLNSGVKMLFFFFFPLRLDYQLGIVGSFTRSPDHHEFFIVGLWEFD